MMFRYYTYIYYCTESLLARYYLYTLYIIAFKVYCTDNIYYVTKTEYNTITIHTKKEMTSSVNS